MHADNSARLARAAQARHQQTLQRARTALDAMAEQGEPVTVAGLAARARVSRSWLYTQSELRDRIEQLRHNHREACPPAPATDSRASADSLRRRLELAHQHIGQLRTENQQLRDALARAHGHLRVDNLTS